MNYLQDKKNKQKKILQIAAGVLLVSALVFFHGSIFSSLSSVGHTLFRPMLVLGNITGGRISNISTFFKSQKKLLAEKDNLKYELSVAEGKLAGYEAVLAENIRLREILGRTQETENLVVSDILSKPPQSPYDTLLIDTGTREGIAEGDLVLALGFLPIGRVAAVYPFSAKVILFSSPGQETEVSVSAQNIFLQAVGRGGGNFEAIVPREMELAPGTEAILPGTSTGLVATVATTISDPRDAFKKVLLVAPVNIQELKFVQVKMR